jgi:hypothetical protein
LILPKNHLEEKKEMLGAREMKEGWGWRQVREGGVEVGSTWGGDRI